MNATPNAPALLRIDRLVKRFGGLAATDGASLRRATSLSGNWTMAKAADGTQWPGRGPAGRLY